MPLPSRLSQEANIQGDPHLYGDTSVLRNRAEIRHASRLSQFQSDHFFARLLELHENPIRGSFDSDHLRPIHRYLFQCVCAWAGEFRTVPIAKGNSFFARPEHIGPELQKLFHQLAGEQPLRGNRAFRVAFLLIILVMVFCHYPMSKPPGHNRRPSSPATEAALNQIIVP